jgi:hypothetical protein
MGERSAVPARFRQTGATIAQKAPVAFLSYAHADSEIAFAFREALSACGLEVIIDTKNLALGEDLVNFARSSVRRADATICVISTASLSSAWVIFEAVSALQSEHVDPSRRLIACAIDQDFLQPEFRLTLTTALDEKLLRLDELLLRYVEQRLATIDISAERDRLIQMRSDLGDVLARLKNSLTLTLTREGLTWCAQAAADYIRQLKGLAPFRIDPRDIGARAEELRRFLWDGRTDDALDRMLDFVVEFSDLPKKLRDATLISNSLRRIEQAETEKRVRFSAAEKQRQPLIYKLLELIDQIEVDPRLPMAS